MEFMLTDAGDITYKSEFIPRSHQGIIRLEHKAKGDWGEKEEGMKAFLVGLIFLIAVGILAGIGILFYPLIIVLDFFLEIILALVFIIFSIWLLGKFIIFVWERIFKANKITKK